MLIDWFTVAAQIVNFLILLALLKWLLFDRIVRAMDQREEKIANRLEEAADKHEEAERRVRELEDRRARLDSQREQILQEAREEAEQQRSEMVRNARQEVDQLRRDWQRDLKRQQEQFIGEMGDRAGEALKRAVRQALTDLARADSQDGIIRVFLNRLEEMDGSKREALGKAIEEAGGKVVVASAEELPQDVRRRIAEALKQLSRDDIKTVFETSPDLISGLEIRSHGHALGWNLRQYLSEFDQTLAKALHEQAETAGSQTE